LNILLIEDENETASYVAKGLRQAGHTVERVASGSEGLSLGKRQSHDLLIVDRMLPDLDGLSLTRQLRESGVQIPVLFLTALGGVSDRVDGLEAGGDDYLVKPFALSELIARVNALTRRTIRVGADVPTRLKAGDLEMDLIGRTVSRAGASIDLQPQEFRLLEYLVRHAGRIVTRSMLLENVWELGFDPQTNIVESHMSRLRAKLDRNFPSPLIETVRGAGYVLRAE
jgi:two-component system, OmpR family, response regulator